MLIKEKTQIRSKPSSSFFQPIFFIFVTTLHAFTYVLESINVNGQVGRSSTMESKTMF